MLRTHTCGELRINNVNQDIVLCGWVQRVRDKGSVLWVDLRDRYGLTQLIFEEGVADAELMQRAAKLGREFVIKASGQVVERISKNDKISTGDIEIRGKSLEVLNPSKAPPFTIDDNTDGGDDLRMRYRYYHL